LSSVVLAAISWKISNIALNRAQGETLTRLKWEVYNNGQEFEGVVSQAWNKDTYYAAFNTKLQNPRPRLFDYTTLDRFTFEIGYLGTSSDKAAASAARQAALDVWHLIEAEFKKEEWQTGIDATRKTKLDNAINKIVTEKIIEPFR
jgi:hypothetical protein